MDFVKGQLVRSKAGRDNTRSYAGLEVVGVFVAGGVGWVGWGGNPKRKKSRHVAPTATVLGNELLKSDQPISDAIKAYDAEHPF